MAQIISKMRRVVHHGRQLREELPVEDKKTLERVGTVGFVAGVVLGHVASVDLAHVFEPLRYTAIQDLASFAGAVTIGVTAASAAFAVIESGRQELVEAPIVQNIES